MTCVTVLLIFTHFILGFYLFYLFYLFIFILSTDCGYSLYCGCLYGNIYLFIYLFIYYLFIDLIVNILLCDIIHEDYEYLLLFNPFLLPLLILYYYFAYCLKIVWVFFKFFPRTLALIV